MVTRRFLLTAITTSSRAQNLPLNAGCIHDRGTRIAGTIPCFVVAATFGGLCLRVVGVDDLLSLRLGENLRSHLHEFVQPDGLAAFTDDSWFSVKRRHGRIGARRSVCVCSANITDSVRCTHSSFPVIQKVGIFVNFVYYGKTRLT